MFGRLVRTLISGARESTTRAPLVLQAVLGLVLAFGPLTALAQSPRWWKGNLHTHSLWSDGDDYPEMIVAWYKENGYDFLGLSDHNVLQTGEKWVTVTTNRNRIAAFEKYVKRFGESWVEVKEEGGQKKVRLKTLEEFRKLSEEPGKFLLIQCEEISANYQQSPIHINASNLREVIPPQGGNSIRAVLQNNIDAVLEQRRRTGQPMVPHINHPNFIWVLTAEDIMLVRGERFLEIYNGHPVTKDPGDAEHASTERIWDVVLTRRLGELGLEAIWGTAVDDAHSYHNFRVGSPNPGRGWTMVWAAALTPEAIIAAMEAGDFYSTSGVRLKEVRREAKRLAIEIEDEPGVTFTTRFIGTRKGYDLRSEPVRDKDGKEIRATRRYSAEVGAVLAEVKGLNPSYALKGDEIYVRATITSSKAKDNPAFQGDREQAWVQPLVVEANTVRR
ncbi:MAG: hypothetical protein KJ070_16535 [Verrucomicrobia bacterium]|nr:hypothetical protein [Verrucomicrobiota bacterium]